jgi:hypothetical protein
MRYKIGLIFMIVMLVLTGIVGVGLGEVKQMQILEESQPWIDTNNYLLGQWLRMRSYNNYAPSSMPDFDQRQDKWQKIDAGQNQQINSVVTNDDVLVGVSCIAPGNNAHLDSTASGDDEVIWYFCGPTATANALWYIDSKHEKNKYPDNNQDTCNLVTKYAGISDDHDPGNVPKLIEDLAVNFLGTSGQCTTLVKDIKTGAWNYINNSKLKGQYKVILYDTNNISLDKLKNWIQFDGTIILRLDTPERGHFVTLQAVNNVTNQIIISDPDFDGPTPGNNHTNHNNASIVNHDTYNVNPVNLRVQSYPEDPCFITHAVNIWKKPIIGCIFIYPQGTVDMGDYYTELVQVVNADQTTDDCVIYYYLSNGFEYPGGAMVNGIPNEPVIQENMLIWNLPGMYPGQIYEVEFQIFAINPEDIEHERIIRTWLYASSIDTELYDDDFGNLEIIDLEPPIIENVHHILTEFYVQISCNVYDNMQVSQVKTIITKPDEETIEVAMNETINNYYLEIINISNWENGNYRYYIWAEDLAGNQRTSNEQSFSISDELIANANGPYFGKSGEIIQFNGTVSGGIPPYNWLWNFGDGNVSTKQNPTHSYFIPNNYTIRLAVTDSIFETDIDFTWVSIEEEKIPDLEGVGSLSWDEIEPGVIITGSFQVVNIGDEDSNLHWMITDYPEWGNWSFEPMNGTNLTPNSGAVEVFVEVEVPDQEDSEFTGEIKLINIENDEDFDIIPVTLTTPKNKGISLISLFQRFFFNYPNLFLLIHEILGWN